MSTTNEATGSVVTNSRLSKVFGIHRFVAGFFALQLFFAADAMGPVESAGEELLFKSWAGFITIISYTVHKARYFRRQDQMGIGMGLVVCFLLGTSVQMYYIATATFPEMAFAGLVATTAVFFALFAAYVWALLEPMPMVTDGTPVAPKSIVTVVLSIHRIALNMLSLIMIMYPNLAFRFLFNHNATTIIAQMITQEMGCFVLAVANFAHVGSAFPSAASRTTVAEGILVGFLPITFAYVAKFREGVIPVDAAFLLMAGTLIVYSTALTMYAATTTTTTSGSRKSD